MAQGSSSYLFPSVGTDKNPQTARFKWKKENREESGTVKGDYIGKLRVRVEGFGEGGG